MTMPCSARCIQATLFVKKCLVLCKFALTVNDHREWIPTGTTLQTLVVAGDWCFTFPRRGRHLLDLALRWVVKRERGHELDSAWLSLLYLLLGDHLGEQAQVLPLQSPMMILIRIHFERQKSLEWLVWPGEGGGGQQTKERRQGVCVGGRCKEAWSCCWRW